MKEIQGDNVLIVGFGKEGKSVLRYLETNHPDVGISVSDRNPDSVTDPGRQMFSGEDYLENTQSFSTVVRSPGISKDVPELQRAKHVTSATNIFFAESKGVIIGVTGTKGKSTTAALIHNILESSGQDSRLVGNIGNPALDYLDGSDEKTIFVTELSSFQLDDCRYSAHIAAILPLRREHLDYHSDFKSYKEAKSNVAKHQGENDIVIYNSENTHSTEIAQSGDGTKIPYPGSPQVSRSCWVDNEQIWTNDNEGRVQMLMRIEEVPLQGKANIENALLAVSVALSMNIDLDQIFHGIESFKPLEHRLEKVGTTNDITYYNDSLATISEATMHALEALGERVETLITGGLDRDGEYKELGKAIEGSGVSHLILFPTTGERIKKAILAANPSCEIEFFETDNMVDAVRFASENTSPGNICLMSPASASFNLFKNYAERGNAFKQAVVDIEKLS